MDPHIGLIVVADGMGGHTAGEVASNEAIAALQAYLTDRQGMGTDVSDDSTLAALEFPAPGAAGRVAGVNSTRRMLDQVLAAVLRANDRLYAINQERGLPPEKSMGTTLVGVVCAPDEPWCTVAFHVGDSRLYRLRDGRIELLTRDHSLHQDWLEDGQVGAEPPRNILTQGIGPQPHIKPAVSAPSFRRGDMLLLCSDGLSTLVDDAQLERLLCDADHTRLDITCQALVAAANDRGGDDNITAVLALRQ